MTPFQFSKIMKAASNRCADASSAREKDGRLEDAKTYIIASNILLHIAHAAIGEETGETE